MSTKINKIISGTGLMALAYFISRFLGLLREMVIADKFGAKGITDVYNASFTIPDFLNYMLAGGAFSIVLIPMISKYLSDTKPPQITKRGQEIFSAILTPVVLMVILLTVVIFFLTPWFTALAFPAFRKDPVKFAMTVRLTRIILPAQIFFIVGGLINATLRARGDFRGNAWGPNIYNLFIILGGVVLGGFIGIEGLSIGVLVGAFLGPFFMCYWWARHSIQYTLSFDFKSADLREYIRLHLPLMVGISLLTVDQLFIRIFGGKAGIAEGTITCLNYSRTIMLVPIALVGQATGQVSLTYLSQLWQQGNTEEFSRTLNQTIRGVMYLAFIFTGAIFLLAHPTTTILFFHGAFTLKNNHVTTMLLQIMIFAVPAFAGLQIIVNGYYARKNTLRPMIISSISTAFVGLIYYMATITMGGPGIALATAVGFWLAFGVMLFDYNHKYGRHEGFMLQSFLLTAFKALVASGVGILLSLLVFTYSGLCHFNPDKRSHAILLMGLVGVFYTSVVFSMSLLMGGEDARILKELVGKIWRKVKRFFNS